MIYPIGTTRIIARTFWLPNKYVPDPLEVDEDIDVFVYTDSEDRPIATTLTPTIQRDEFAGLQVVAVTDAGAFLDWGLEKDLLVPHREQARPMVVGQWYVVFMYLDRRTNRLVASSKVNRFLDPDIRDLYVGERSAVAGLRNDRFGRKCHYQQPVQRLDLCQRNFPYRPGLATH